MTARRISAACWRRQPRRRLRGPRRDHARHQRVPLRHHPADVPVHAANGRACSPRRRSRAPRRTRLRHRRRGHSASGSATLISPAAASTSPSAAATITPASSWAPSRATALWGAIGVGLGAIVRNQVGAIIGLLAWGFVVENLLFAFVPSVGRFAPVHAQDALIGLTTKHLLHPTPGGLMLIAWTAALGLIGAALAARRDVN